MDDTDSETEASIFPHARTDEALRRERGHLRVIGHQAETVDALPK